MHTACPVCSSQKINPLRKYENNHLGRCASCGFVFCLPVPTADELNQYYSGYGSVENISPITIQRYHELLDAFEPFRKTNRIIDVGCGRSHFLKTARERGWNVYGTEYSDELVNHGRNMGIEMFKGDITEAGFESGKFDVVTSFEVLEHTWAVKQQVNTYNHILRKEGALYLTTPDFNSIIRRYVGADYSVINYPEHLTYFTKKTLHRLLKDSGFEKKFLHSHGISFTRLRRSKLKENVDNNSLSNPDEELRIKIEKSRWRKIAKNTLNCVLNITGSGHSLKSLYIKK